MTCGPGLHSLAHHPRCRIARRIFITLHTLLAVALACGLPSMGVPAANAAAEPAADQVILFLGQNYTGPSKNWSLGPDQPFLAVPYTGDEFRPVSASIKLGSDVGVLLFERPFFSTTDETCDYRLGNAADPGLWWLSDKAMFVPGPDEHDRVEGNLRSQEIASLILYRRDLGPPPGVLLLERRRYINWDCQAPTKARSYKRLFVPVAPPPHREGCFNLDAALAYGESGKVALDFAAASELLLLLPRDQSADYTGVDHRFTAVLHDGKDCTGASALFAHPQSETRRFELKEVNLDRKARSVLLRYDQGPYDAVLLAAEPDGTAAGEAGAETSPGAETDADQVQAEAETAAQSSAEPAGEVDDKARPEVVESASGAAADPGNELASDLIVESRSDSIAEPAAERAAEPVAEPAATIAAEPAATTAGESETSATTAEPPAPAIGGLAPAAASDSPTETQQAAEPEAGTPEAEALLPETPESAPPESAPAEPEAPEAATIETETVEATSETTHAPEPATLEPETPEPATLEPETPEPATPEPATPELETSDPAASEPETAGFLVLPEPEADTSGGQTFEFPLLQGYRLSACLYERESCGEAAASEWCKARGFAGGAAAFEIDENIGSLFPTLSLGDLQLCANFVCDGFKEITCLP